MALGLRASLPKLPSFRRRVQEAKVEYKNEKVSKTSLEKSPAISLSKKRRMIENDADLEGANSIQEGKRMRTTSNLIDDDDDRSQSPWQHIDDNLEAAPPAMDVRVSQGMWYLFVHKFCHKPNTYNFKMVFVINALL